MVHNVKRGKTILKAEDPAERKRREDEARALRAAKQAEEEARLRAAEEAAEAERLRLEAEAAAKAAREAEAAARAARLAAKRAAAAEEAARRAAAKKAEEEAEAARKAATAALVTMKPKDEEASRRPPPPWNDHVHPRVERSSKRQAIAFRAKPDPRPSSVAFETTAEIPDHQRAPGGLAMLLHGVLTLYRFVTPATEFLSRGCVPCLVHSLAFDGAAALPDKLLDVPFTRSASS